MEIIEKEKIVEHQDGYYGPNKRDINGKANAGLTLGIIGTALGAWALFGNRRASAFGGLSGGGGSTNINVLQADSIYVINEATGKNVSTLTLSPGQKVNLSASASCRTIPLTGGDSSFAWTADADIGTISSDGLFTAGPNTATGKIKVATGRYAITISVAVNAPARYTLLSDFEGATPDLTGKNATLTLDSSQAQ